MEQPPPQVPPPPPEVPDPQEPDAHEQEEYAHSPGKTRLIGLAWLIGGLVVSAVAVWLTIASYNKESGSAMMWTGGIVLGIIGIYFGSVLIITAGRPMTPGMKKGLKTTGIVCVVGLIGGCSYFVFRDIDFGGRGPSFTQEQLADRKARREAERQAEETARLEAERAEWLGKGLLELTGPAAPPDGAWHDLVKGRPFPGCLAHTRGNLIADESGAFFISPDGVIRAYLHTRDGQYMDDDFQIDIVFEPHGEPTGEYGGQQAWVGIGDGEPGLRKDGYRPNNALFAAVMFQQKSIGDFILARRETTGRYGRAIPSETFGTIREHRQYMLRIEKRGEDLRFSLDTDYQGAFKPRIHHFVPHAAELYPFLAGSNQRLFFAGHARFNRVMIKRMPVRAAPENPKKLEIVKAEWGENDNRVDVTEQVRRLVKNHTLAVAVEYGMFDENPSQITNHLWLEYTIDGKAEKHTVASDSMLILNPNRAGWAPTDG